MATSEVDPLEQVIMAVSGFYNRKDLAHDLGHALRVRSWARLLAIEEGADLLIVELAALLHDIGRSGTVARTHAESSAELAVGILTKLNYSEEIIVKVKGSIVAHSREDFEPETLEDKILYDADKLDFVGPIGLARLFAMAGVEGWQFTDENSAESFYHQRICSYQKFIYTETAQRNFNYLYSFMEQFWELFYHQVNNLKA